MCSLLVCLGVIMNCVRERRVVLLAEYYSNNVWKGKRWILLHPMVQDRPNRQEIRELSKLASHPHPLCSLTSSEQ